MNIIRTEVEPEIKKLLPPDGRVIYGAAANHLDNALWTMGKNFALAVLILFLIMAAMFKSLRDSAIATIALAARHRRRRRGACSSSVSSPSSRSIC